MVMGVRRHHGRNLSAALALIFFFATAMGSALVSITQEKEESDFISTKRLEDKKWEQSVASRRRLTGPGSSPPTCRSRCGRCFPCWPVHVAIQPGRSFPLEYYPEAWRCKCGNKLFMP